MTRVISVDEAAGRMLLASDMNKLLTRLGCTHIVAVDLTPFGPYWCHIIDEHCS